jgi:hypothetical protein
MPVAVQMPNQKQKRDPLDTIMAGLNIATTVFGIKEGADKARLLAEQQKVNAENDKFSRMAKEAELGEKGYEIQRDDDGNVVALTPPGNMSIDNRYKTEQTNKLMAETEAIKKGRTTGGDPEMRDLRKLIAQQQLTELQRKADAEAAKLTPEGRLKALAGTDKQRLDNAKLGLTSIQGMADALLAKDENTFSLWGDNNFTQQSTLFEEALGRMQSGGAITEEEAERFRRMRPTFRDEPDIQRKKLVQLQSEFQSRLGTLGFAPQDLGVDVANIQGMTLQGNSGGSVLTPPKANAEPAPRVTPPPKPKIVRQGGKEFILNERTGQYE